MLNHELSLNPHVFSPTVGSRATRDGFGEALVELGKLNPRVLVLTGDLSESTRTQEFQKAFPERFVECGVAEQNMMGVAAGLALSGNIPFITSYATFSPGRNWDQLRVSVCYSNANVKVIGAHAGLSVGPDGATHQALEDIAITRVLPNLLVIVPCDAEEARKATHAISTHVGPCYLRLTREKTPTITTEETPFVVGKHAVCREGAHVTIAACGPLLHEALLAALHLSQEGIEAEVLNCHTIKPFDTDTLVTSVKKTGCCVTVEEHQVSGGLFSTVTEALARTTPVPVEPVAMQDRFGESGDPRQLLEKYHLMAADITAAAKRVMSRT